MFDATVGVDRDDVWRGGSPDRSVPYCGDALSVFNHTPSAKLLSNLLGTVTTTIECDSDLDRNGCAAGGVE